MALVISVQREDQNKLFVRWNCTGGIFRSIFITLRYLKIKMETYLFWFYLRCLRIYCHLIFRFWYSDKFTNNYNTTTTQQPHMVQSLFDFSNSNIKRMLTLPVENNLRTSVRMSHLHLFIFKQKESFHDKLNKAWFIEYKPKESMKTFTFFSLSMNAVLWGLALASNNHFSFLGNVGLRKT